LCHHDDTDALKHDTRFETTPVDITIVTDTMMSHTSNNLVEIQFGSNSSHFSPANTLNQARHTKPLESCDQSATRLTRR